jgi:hypothetical protein
MADSLWCAPEGSLYLNGLSPSGMPNADASEKTSAPRIMLSAFDLVSQCLRDDDCVEWLSLHKGPKTLGWMRY